VCGDVTFWPTLQDHQRSYVLRAEARDRAPFCHFPRARPSGAADFLTSLTQGEGEFPTSLTHPSRRQAIGPDPLVQIPLLHLLPDGVGRRFKLFRQLLRRPACSDQLHDLLPNFPRVQSSRLGMMDSFLARDAVSTFWGRSQAVNATPGYADRRPRREHGARRKP
jgi:hypothetical protein